jgi:hypothetical protein
VQDHQPPPASRPTPRLAPCPPNPVRSEEELDPVTLHNSALANMEADPAAGFRKLNHLLSLGAGRDGGMRGRHELLVPCLAPQWPAPAHTSRRSSLPLPFPSPPGPPPPIGSFPPETFPNLLLLYASPAHGFLDLAADVMADNPQLVATTLSRVLGGGVREGGSGSGLGGEPLPGGPKCLLPEPGGPQGFVGFEGP